MKKRVMGNIAFAAVAGFLLAAPVTLAQDIRKETVHFKAGTSGTTIQGRIKGYESVSYLLGAKAGQVMHARLSTRHGATYFNIYGPGKGPGDEAIAVSDRSDPINTFEGVLPEDGNYTISVYMMRSAARRNEVSDYSLDISIGGKAAARTVGQACISNHTPILVPCHRVVGGNGLLSDYVGGLWRKRWLLQHEASLPDRTSER